MITAQTDTSRAIAKLFALPGAIRSGVSETMQAGMLELLADVQAKLSGAVLNAGSGRLRDSIQAELTDDGARIAARVFSDGSVPYAHIQEFGGRIAVPEIMPVQARALVFAYGGRMVFAKRATAHVVTIPERSYLRSSLDDHAGDIVANIRKVAFEACG
jgi:phage gpG-like protein